MKKHLFILMLALFAGIHTASASSGTCGEHLRWDLTDGGVLNISGTGDMKNYDYPSQTPWYHERSSIESIKIGSGVTSIGNCAFEGCSDLTSASIPNSVTKIGDDAFRDCGVLTSVKIPDSVTSIGIAAFEGCRGLTSMTIPNSVTSIGNCAFENCSGLTSVTISNSVTSIGAAVFQNCRSLTLVSIPNSVTCIGSDAFNGCSGLTAVIIPNSVTSIGDNAFSGCNGLKAVHISDLAAWCKISFGYMYSANPLYYAHNLYLNGALITDLVIPNSVTSISNYAFRDCSKLTSVTIPNSVTSIGSSAFDGCSGLTSVTIPNSVTSIGGYAFSGCSGLTTVTIPNSVTSIGGYAFSDCSGLTSVTIPNSVTKIGDNAFSGCNGLKAVHISDLAAWCKISFGDKGANPLCYANSLYLNGTLITDLIIPDGVTSIGGYAFSCCSGLKTVTIPNSVTRIDGYAFYGCSGLTSVTIPNSVTSIGNRVFYGCSGLTSVNIPNSVTSIDYYAFYNCKISDLYFLGSMDDWLVKKFNPSYISKSYTLYINNEIVRDIEIPNSFTSIDNYAFSGCSGLTSVSLPNSVTSIGIYAFSGCSGLTSVTIPNSVTIIGMSAFSGCSGLTSVNIPNSVISIGSSALYNVQNIVYNGTATGAPWGAKSVNGYVDGYFVYNDESKTKLLGCSPAIEGDVSIPNSVTCIGDNAFYDCSGLTSVTIPNSVTSIGNNAFKNCEISSLYFSGSMSDWYAKKFSPSSISESYTLYINNEIVRDIEIPYTSISISYDLFYGCSSLSSVTIPNSVIYIESNAFYNCSGLTSVTIPNSVISISENAFYNVLNIIYNGTATGSPWGALNVNGYVEAPLVYNDESKTELRGCFRDYKGDVSIPNSVTSIGNNAFYDCSGLTSVTIPNSVTSIGDDAFNGCSGLTKVTIPNSVTRIGGYAFYGCSGLTSVTIGSDVKSIGGMCFSFDVDKLPIVTCYTQKVPIAKKTNYYDYDPFGIYTKVGNNWDFTGDNYSLLTVYVPASSVDNYKADEYWGLYNIQPIEAEQQFTDHLAVESTTDAVEIVWPKVQGATTYELKIVDKDEQDVCTLIFNDAGQLQTIVFRAPAIDGHRTPQEESQGFRFTITGLTENTNYALTIVAKDENGEVLSTEQKSFKTKKIGDDGNVLPTYTITFVNYDNTELLTLTEVEEGSMPVYTGETPMHADDDEYTYTFSGWTPEIVAAEADATYTATYTAIKRTDAIDDINAITNTSLKVFKDGQVNIIMPNGKIFNTLGVEVK